jgi:hypothetical protein
MHIAKLVGVYLDAINAVLRLRERVGGALGGGALLLKGERLESVRVQRATAGPRL